MSTKQFLAWEPTDDGAVVARSLVFENDGLGIQYRIEHRYDVVADDAWYASVEGKEIAAGTLPEVLAACQKLEESAVVA